MMITIWLILGLIAGAGYLAYAMLRGWRRELWIYATGLAVAAAIYLVFTLPTLDIAWFGIEAAGLVCYGLFAFVGWRVNPLALAAGRLSLALTPVYRQLSKGVVRPGYAARSVSGCAVRSFAK